MFRALLPELEGLAVLKMVSLLLFVGIFIIACLVVMRMSRQHVQYMERLPLDDNPLESQRSGEKSHG